MSKRYKWWNFVSSKWDRIEQAKQDWRSGKFATVPKESEFIPLPKDIQTFSNDTNQEPL